MVAQKKILGVYPVHGEALEMTDVYTSSVSLGTKQIQRRSLPTVFAVLTIILFLHRETSGTLVWVLSLLGLIVSILNFARRSTYFGKIFWAEVPIPDYRTAMVSLPFPLKQIYDLTYITDNQLIMALLYEKVMSSEKTIVALVQECADVKTGEPFIRILGPVQY